MFYAFSSSSCSIFIIAQYVSSLFISSHDCEPIFFMFRNVASFSLFFITFYHFSSLFFNVSSSSMVVSLHCPVICHDFSQFPPFVYHFFYSLSFHHFLSVSSFFFLIVSIIFYHLPITFMMFYHFHLFSYHNCPLFSLIFVICRFHQSSQLLRRIALSCEASFDSGPPAPPKKKSQKEFHPFVRPLMLTKLYTLSLNPDCKNCEP